MGVDLKLLFLDCGDTTSFSQLECDRDYDLHEEIKKLGPFERNEIILHSFCSKIPDGSMKGERCFGRTDENPYGERITYLKVKHLEYAFRQWYKKVEDKQPISFWNCSIWKFLESIHNQDMFVALFWH